MSSTDPARHVPSLVGWAEGLMFDRVAGSIGTEAPGLAEARAGPRELPVGCPADDTGHSGTRALGHSQNSWHPPRP
ncbi:hypothetical protein [Streptomyces sp. NPDC093591]|uniref:hypothetical protein n=1 Tax=Streptomyces sp. NPDC093591 TaxID=3366044 RepID=UPI00380B66B8